MPLTEEQTAALATLAAADPKEVADALKEHAPNAYQTAFRVGYGTAKGEFEPKLTAKDDQIQALTAERDEKAQALAAATQGDEATQQRIAALEKAATDAKAAREAAEAAADDRVRAVYRSAEDKALLAGLVAAGVDKDYAAGAVLPTHAARVRLDAVTDEGPAISYLDADGVTPLSGGRDAFVQQVAASVPAKFKTSNVDGGGGASAGGGSAATNRYAALQQAAKDAGKTGPEADSTLSEKRAARWGVSGNA